MWGTFVVVVVCLFVCLFVGEFQHPPVKCCSNVAILVLSYEKMSACPSTPPS